MGEGGFVQCIDLGRSELMCERTADLWSTLGIKTSQSRT